MSDLTGRPAYQRVRPVKDPEFYRAWALAHPYCQACGRPEGGFPPNSTHHIIKPGRSDEACNLLRLCHRCHDLAEGRTIRVDGVALPTLSIGVCLTLKRLREPEQFDATRLAELFRQTLPDFEPVPEFLTREWTKRRRVK